MSILPGISDGIDTPFGTSVQTNTGKNSQATGSTFLVGSWGNKSSPTITDAINGVASGNSWTQILTRTFSTSFSSLNFCQGANGGTNHRFTATQTSGGGLGLLVMEITGAVLSGGAAVTPTATEPTGATSTVACQAMNPGAVTLLVNFIGGSANGSGAPTSSGGIWTMLQTLGTTNFVPAGMSYTILASPASDNDTFTFPGQTSYDMVAFAIAFAQSGGGGSNTASIAWTS